MTLTSGMKLGPYEILSPLGTGGMGEVWKAKDTRLDRFVAIKVLPEHLVENADALARFEREAKAVAALNHPNILAIFDIGKIDGTAYAVMELLEGESLRDRLAQGPLPPRKVTELAIQMANGLAAAHEKGVIHRDLKPDNLWITKDGRLKILDFGLAKQVMAPKHGSQSFLATEAVSPGHVLHTEEGMILGTMGYMSPEQIRGENVDARSDIFSFGVVLYEMLTGTRAFARGTAADTMAAILKEDPPDFETTSRSIPPGLQRVVQHCLEKDPAHRFQETHDLAFALESQGAGSGSQAAPAAFSRPRRRARIPVLLGIAAALLVGFGFLEGRKTAPVDPPIFRRLTFGRGTIDGARFVPGSRDIAYSARWQGNPSTIFLLREGSMESRALDVAGAMLLGTSRQGAAVVLTQPALFDGLFEGTVSVVPLAGGGTRQICREAYSADFAGDGVGLCIVTMVNGNMYQLEWPQGETLLNPSSFILRNPRVLGTQVAFFQSPPAFPSNGEIRVMVKGGQPRALASCKGFTALAWGPDGGEIWFSTFDGGESLIQAVSLKGKVRLLARYPGRLELVDVDPGGLCLAIASSNLRQAFGRAAGTDRDVDLTWLDAQMPLALRADGSQVLLAHSEDWEMSNKVGLYLRSLSGGPAVNLGMGSLMADLSRDGKWVATFEADAKGQAGLRLVPTGVGTSRWFPLTGATSTSDGLAFHPLGASIYLMEEETLSVSRLDLGTGTLTPNAPPGKLGFSAGLSPFSPDGKHMLLTDMSASSPSDDRLFRYMLFEGEKGKPLPTKGNLNTETVASWADNNLEVYLYDRNAIPAEVVRWNPQTGTRRPFLRITPPDPSGAWGISYLTITPSGRAYAYSVLRKLSDLYLIEGLK